MEHIRKTEKQIIVTFAVFHKLLNDLLAFIFKRNVSV